MLVTVPSFAKLNLDLRVLHKRGDGYHELRTIFQTISLKDSLRIDFTRARRTKIELDSSIDIPENLVVRAAHLALHELKVNAHIRFKLKKQIPMGAGMGGGSSNAAAVLLALPTLAGKRIDVRPIAESLGSDVPFFLYGGTALGLGRGTELYPLPDLGAHPVLVVSTGIHVSTAQAYQALGRNVTNALTSPEESNILREFQAIAWALDGHSLEQIPFQNDFEAAVFKHHPELAAVVRKLKKMGARPALMTGSGSAVFGIFESEAQMREAAGAFPGATTFQARFVSRQRYKTLWRRALLPANGETLSKWQHQ